MKTTKNKNELLLLPFLKSVAVSFSLSIGILVPWTPLPVKGMNVRKGKRGRQQRGGERGERERDWEQNEMREDI